MWLGVALASFLCVNTNTYIPTYRTIEKDNQLVMYSVSTNGERASLANLKLTIGSLLECS